MTLLLRTSRVTSFRLLYPFWSRVIWTIPSLSYANSVMTGDPAGEGFKENGNFPHLRFSFTTNYPPGKPRHRPGPVRQTSYNKTSPLRTGIFVFLLIMIKNHEHPLIRHPLHQPSLPLGSGLSRQGRMWPRGSPEMIPL